MLPRLAPFIPFASDTARPILLGHATSTGRPVTLEPQDLRAHMLVSGRTGGGKSRFLIHLLASHIEAGRPVFLLDPTGVMFRAAREIVATGLLKRSGQRAAEPPELFLQRHLFFDLDDPGNTLRINPLQNIGQETSEERAGDLLAALERIAEADFTASARRLLNLLSHTLIVLAELNCLPEQRRPPFPGASWPLNLSDIPAFLTGPAPWRTRLLAALPHTPAMRFAREFFCGQFHQYSDSQRTERVESTFNLIAPLLSSDVVHRLFGTRQSTFHLPDLLRRGVSLYVHVPLGRSFQAARIAGTYLTTGLQRAAYRRSLAERQRPYWGLIDEFQNFAGTEFAAGFANLRQYGLFWAVAHQDQSQDPFHTPEGRNMLESIRANTRIKVLFPQSRADSESHVKSLFRLSQQQGFLYGEASRSVGQSRTQTFTRSQGRSRTASRAIRRGVSRSLARTDGLSIGISHGTTIGETLTEGLSSSVADGLARTVARSEQEGVTTGESEEHGLSVTFGENFSHLIDHRLGLTFTESRGESLALLDGISLTHTSSHQRGHTETTGGSTGRTTSEQHTLALGHESGSGETRGEQYTETAASSYGTAERSETGTTLVHSADQTGIYMNDDPSSRSDKEGSALTRQESESVSTGRTDLASSSHSRSSSVSVAKAMGLSQAQTDSYSEAISLIRSIAEAIGRTQSQTTTRQTGSSEGWNEGVGEQAGSGRSRANSESQGFSSSSSLSRQKGRTDSHAVNRTLTEAQHRDLARSFSRLQTFSQGLSQSIQQTIGSSEDVTLTEQQSVSEGISAAHARGESRTSTVQQRRHFLGLDGERELAINTLQALPVQHCVVSTESLQNETIKVVEVPDTYWDYTRGDLPRQLSRLQTQRQKGERDVDVDSDLLYRRRRHSLPLRLPPKRSER